MGGCAVLIPMAEIQERWGVNPKVIVHAGGHRAEEIDGYAAAGAERVLWIEGNAELIPDLRSIVSTHPGGMDNRVAHALLAATSGQTMTLNISNNGMSSSVLPLGTHATVHPEVKFQGTADYVTRTLDEVAEEYGFLGADLLELDLQAYECEALRGAERLLESCQWVYSELNCDPLYTTTDLLPELDGILVAHGFELVQVVLAGCQRRDCSDRGNRWTGWGDGIFVRKENPRPYAETHPEDWLDWCGNQ